MGGFCSTEELCAIKNGSLGSLDGLLEGEKTAKTQGCGTLSTCNRGDPMIASGWQNSTKRLT